MHVSYNKIHTEKRIEMNLFASVCTRTNSCYYICIYICIYIYVYIYICIYVCVYIYHMFVSVCVFVYHMYIYN